MKKIIALAFALSACGHARHKHHVEKVEYELPCIIEGVRFQLQPTASAANAKCGKRNADDGKPLKDGEIFAGCFNPSVTIGNGEDEITFSGEIISEMKWEYVKDEMEHLLFHACRVGRITRNDQ